MFRTRNGGGKLVGMACIRLLGASDQGVCVARSVRGRNLFRMENEARRTSDWWVFVQDQLDRRQWNGADFERETGISRSRLNSWKAGGAPTPEIARTCAKAFGVKPVEAFIYAGWLDADEAAPVAHIHADLAAFSNQALVRELERRLDGQTRAPVVAPSMDVIRANPERFTLLGLERGPSYGTRWDNGPEPTSELTEERNPQNGG